MSKRQADEELVSSKRKVSKTADDGSLPAAGSQINTTSENPNEQSATLAGAHTMRITTHGKIRSWVKWGLNSLEEGRAVVLHTLPLKSSDVDKDEVIREEDDQMQPSSGDKVTSTQKTGNSTAAAGAVIVPDSGPPPATAATTSTAPNLTVTNLKPLSRLSNSTLVIPRLISVVEILKREYLAIQVKKLHGKPWPTDGEPPCAHGLEQWNEMGCLEDLGSEYEHELRKIERAAATVAEPVDERAEQIVKYLSGKKFGRIQRTPYMKVTLCSTKLQGMETSTYQAPPPPLPLTKQARRRAKIRAKALEDPTHNKPYKQRKPKPTFKDVENTELPPPAELPAPA